MYVILSGGGLVLGKEVPLFYLEWDDFRSEASPFPSAQLAVEQGELFLRKLVNATWIDQRVWEHISHETDEHGQGLVYVKPWKAELHSYGTAMEAMLHQGYQPSADYRVEWIRLEAEKGQVIHSQSYSDPLQVAELLLDHYRSVNGRDYEIHYAIYDQNRRNTTIFLTSWEEAPQRETTSN